MTSDLPATPPAAPAGPAAARTTARTAARPPRPSHQPGSRPAPGRPRPHQAAPRSAGHTPDTGIPRLPVRIGSPVALLAAIPALLGFGPGRSVVIVGTGSDGKVRLTLRYDLPSPGRTQAVTTLAGHAFSVLAAQGITTAVAVGYGPDAAVAPVAAALRECASAAGITLGDVLRVQDERFWSYLCGNPDCCPAEGTPFDPSGHPAARALAASGGPVLTDRAQLAASLAPATGPLGAAMRRDTAKARARLNRCVVRLDRAGLRMSPSGLTAALGQLAVDDAVRRCRDGEPLDTERAAWLTVALREQRVRDDAWALMDPAHRVAHLRLWTELTRLARRGYVAAPASLLAVVAWQAGDGALANVALDRALAEDPEYSMALLLRRVLDAGMPPAKGTPPMSPDEVAASYDALAARKRSASG
jgi:hypothetical protein